MSVPEETERKKLERRRSVLRARCLEAIDVLDRRGHAAVNLAQDVTSQAPRYLLAAGLCATGATTLITYALHRGAVRRRPMPLRRRLAGMILGEPVLRRSLMFEAARGALISLAVQAVGALGRRAFRRLSEGQNATP